MKNKILAFFLLMLICFCSCATNPYSVTIDSITPNESVDFEKTYTLKQLGSDIEDLYYKEYCLYIKYILSKKGYIFKENGDANLIIFIDYGNGQPKTYYQSYYIPIYGTTTYTSKSKVNGYSFETQTSTFGQTGAVSGVDSHTRYSNYIILYACDKKSLEKDKEIKFLWQTNIYCVNNSGDLREHFPIMLNVAFPYIGEDTYKSIVVDKNISSVDNEIFIKNSLRTENTYVNVKEYIEVMKDFDVLIKDFMKYYNKKSMYNKYNFTEKENLYYSSEKNYEYFNDINKMIKELKDLSYKISVNMDKRENEVKIKILENSILNYIKQGTPINK